MKKHYYIITTIALFACIVSNLKAENMNDASVVPANFLLLNNWTCKDDNEIIDVYRVCNYFPLITGNNWQYTTGDRAIAESKTCSTGYTGVRYASTSYEYDSFMQNGKNGLMFTGCRYQMPEEEFQDLGESVLLIKPEMQIGETINENYPNFRPPDLKRLADCFLFHVTY